MIIRPRYPILKPQGGVVLNGGHRLATGLLSAYLFNEGGGRRVNDIAGIDHLETWGPSGAGSPTWDTARQVLDQTTGVYAVASPRLKINPPLSIAWRGYITGNAAAFAGIFGLSENGTNANPYTSYVLSFDNTATPVVTCYFNRGGTFTAIIAPGVTGASLATGRPSLIVFTADASNNQKLYSNDAAEISSGTYSWSTTQYQSSARVSLGAGNTSDTGNAVARADFGLIWNRALTRDEISELYREPYAWVRPQGPAVRRFFFGFATSQTITGSTTIASGEVVGSGGSVTLAEQFVTGSSAIASGESFFSGGTVSVDLTITGVTTIASGEAFDTGGSVTLPSPQTITGVSTIASGESFLSPGRLDYVLTGYSPIATGETFLTGGAVIGSRAYTVFVRGRDRTNWIRESSINITEEYGGRCAATFQLNNIGRSMFRPNWDDEIVFYWGTGRIFGGLVQHCKEQAFDSRSEVKIDVQCTDYRELADRRTFAKVYTGPTFNMRAILQEIHSSKLAAEGILWSYDDTENLTCTGDRLVFDDDTVSECLNRICAAFGASWRIDHYRRLHVERAHFAIAPHVIRDNGIWRGLQVKRDGSKMRTAQGVRTSVPTGGQRVSTLAGNGTHEYRLAYSLNYAPKVVVNTVEKTVIAWVDRGTAPWDFAWESATNLLRHQPSQTAYTSADSIVVTHASSTLDVLWVEDTAAQARIAERTGGSGIVECVTNARNIRDKGIAQAFASKQRDCHGTPVEELEFETDTLGWHIGQQVSVDTSAPLAFGTFFIQRVSINFIGATFLRYQVSATRRELPMIMGAEVTGANELTIDIDRPHEFPYSTTGEGITFGGIDGELGELLNGGTFTWTTLDGFDEGDDTRLVVNVDPIDLTGIEFTGGLGGYVPETGGPDPGEPFGGSTWTGTGPGGETGGGIGGEDAFVITDVNTTTNEVTTSSAHGFSTTTDANKYRVAIWNVTGATGGTTGGFNGLSINTATTRITVTSTTKFIALDVGSLNGAGSTPFVDDRKGRCASTDAVIRTIGPVDGGGGLLQRFGGAPPSNATQEVGTFFFIGAPVSVGPSAASPWYAQQDLAVLESVSAQFDTPPSGSNVLLDIKQNGVSIFAAGQYLEYPADGTGTVRATAFRESPLTVERDDKFDIDVVGVGSEFAGCNGKVHVVTKA